MPKKDDFLPAQRRHPDELLHRVAHDAAGRATERLIGKISAAYETQLWDSVAGQVLAAIAGTREKSGRFSHPEDAAMIAAEYADALLVERRKRVEGK